MHAKLQVNFDLGHMSALYENYSNQQKVLEGEMEGEKCFENIPKSTDPMVQLTNENLSTHKAACPKLPPDECQDDQPDPPEVLEPPVHENKIIFEQIQVPEPPEEPVCGDLVVEDPAEECDCGFDYLQCQVFLLGTRNTKSTISYRIPAATPRSSLTMTET